MIIASIYGQDIGVLREGKNGIEFEFFESFDYDALPISPLVMNPKNKTLYNYFDNMHTKGMPGIFEDSMPDGFGARLMREYFLKIQGGQTITQLQKLAFVGADGMGAIEYTPSVEAHKSFLIDLETLPKRLRENISGETDYVMTELIKMPSPGGARPKVSVLWDQQTGQMQGGSTQYAKENFEPWIIKFDEDDKELTKIEKLYHDIAKSAGLDVPLTELIVVSEMTHLAIKRFDREVSEKIHLATLSGLTHKDYLEQGLLSYENYMTITQRLTRDMRQTKEAYRRMIFNVIGKNCDDHLKNFSFLMNASGEWRVSPVYDILYNYGPAKYGEHHMSVNGKFSHISREDFIIAGKKGLLRPQWMHETIDEIVDAFDKGLREMNKYKISSKMQEELTKEIGALLHSYKK